jgi:apoptogenic protein 1
MTIYMFVKEREQFIKDGQKKKALAGGDSKETLSADEMSVFYKQFLDKNWQVHVKYNAEWYRKNIGLMLQSFKIQVLKTLGRLSKQ